MSFEIVLLLFGAVGLLLSIISIIRGNRTKEWPSTTGNITSTSLRDSYDSDGDPDGFYPVIHFSYTIDGETYQNTFQKSRLPTKRRAFAFLGQFPTGAPITLFFNPQKPSDITDKRGVRLTAIATMIISFFVCVYSTLKWLDFI